MTTPAFPDFTDSSFLQSHTRFILDFYQDRVVAENGGFYQAFRDDGSIYDPAIRHLVSSTRFVFNYANAARRYQSDEYRLWAANGLTYLQTAHRQNNASYAWVVSADKDGQISISDDRAMAYGHAFVMLAAASAVEASIEGAGEIIDDVWDFMETQFWEPSHGAYADERTGKLDVLDGYRGQNANMHSCEALLAAYRVTENDRYLQRAIQLAEKFAFTLAESTQGLIWEHYQSDWSADMTYNIDKPDDLFKPWGFQPGHQLEWSKLLLQINEVNANPRWLEKAAFLFNEAISRGWDTEHGGLVYGFAPDGSFCDSHKYFWVHAEAFAAAWRLYKVTGEQTYLDHYKRIWEWSWNYLIDHQQGAWFRIRNRDGSAFDDLKSPPGKTDYHTMGACWDVLDVTAASAL